MNRYDIALNKRSSKVSKQQSFRTVSEPIRRIPALQDYPINTDGCFNEGMRGNCGPNCPVFQRGECSEPEGIE